MKAIRAWAAVAVVAGTGATAAIGATTNAALAAVAASVRPVLARLDPAPGIAFRDDAQTLEVGYRTQVFKIHGRSMTGEILTNFHDEVGPGFKGFMFRAYDQPTGEVNQACTPQTLREPYWQTDLDVTPVGRTGRQVYWALSYGSRMPTNVLAELRAAMKRLE